MNAVANHPITQSVTQGEYQSFRLGQALLTIAGPMAESARDQVNKTSNEFNNVANSRKVPDARTATDQPLTRGFITSSCRHMMTDRLDTTEYHSLFYNILSVSVPLETHTYNINRNL